MRTNVYIPPVKVNDHNRKTLFILTRPFITEDYQWKNEADNYAKWNINPDDYFLVSNINEANLVLIPYPINKYYEKGTQQELHQINEQCKKSQIKAYGYIAGDFGEKYPSFSNIIYFRMGGFKSQLDDKNRGFPVMIGDRYTEQNFLASTKQQVPVIGFCGHSSLTIKMKVLQDLKMTFENLKRFIKNPIRKDYEPLFASAYYRSKILGYFEKSDRVITNFIHREKYRAGATLAQDRQKTTIEYFENIKTSDYIPCIRGAGNFSVRLFETLMMGKIPVFVNTNCLLPFENKINWKEHVVWVEWKDRKNIANIVADFHQKISEKDFKSIQIANRKLWKETLSVNNMLEIIKNDF